MRVIALFLILSGCAAVIQVGPAAPDPDPTIIGVGDEPTSEIIIYRAAEAGLLPNVVTTPAILLNRNPVGTCRFGHPLVLRLPAGNYTVTARAESGEENQWVTLEKGDVHHLRCGVVAAPSVSPKPRLDRVDAETAAREARL